MDDDGGAPTFWWHVVRGEHVDTELVPAWLRTGYRYFPYAAWESGHVWVLRINFCFPEHDMVTVFIDGRAVADVTASAEDPRPLLASIGSLPIDGTLSRLALALPAAARQAVAPVAQYTAHGSESGEPCDWCVFAQRDPYARGDVKPIPPR